MRRLSFTTTLFLCSIMVFAQFTGTKSDEQGVQYTSNEDGTTCYVSGLKENYNAEIVIPESYEGLSVTSIGDWTFSRCSGLTSVTIPNSVTSIGGAAFYNCSSLTSVTIGNSVTSIGSWAFRECSGLRKVFVQDIAAWCNISFDNSEDNPLSYAHHLYSNENTEITELIIPNSVTSIGNFTFSGCSGLTSVTIPNSVTSIGRYAFYNCSGLTSVTIGNSVTSIGNGAFWGCSGLTSVTIPNSVTSIGSDAFSGCSGLTSFTLGNSVTSIGENAFHGWKSLKVFNITNLKEWCKMDYAYSDYDNSELDTPFDYAPHLFVNGEEVKDLVIPDGITHIGINAFSGCSGITSVTIPNSVTSIGELAFRNCNSLTSVHITDLDAWCNISSSYYGNPLTYAHHLFLNGEEVKDLVIPNSVTSIGSGAFSGCSGLTSVTIPNSVTSIGAQAFRECSGLTSVTIPNSVTSIGAEAFRECSGLTSVTIPNSVTSIEGGAFRECSGLTSVTIPNSVTRIGGYAFYGCSGLTSVTIPNSVTRIGGYAFYGCSGLTSVTIPNSVTRIEEYAFRFCNSLTSVHITDLDAWCNISSSYYGNPLTYAHHLFLNGEEVKDLVIPNSVTKIGEYAFQGCSGLTSVTIPNSVTRIGWGAFSGCSGLTSVTIPNSVTSIGSGAFSGCSGLAEVISMIEEPFDIKASVWDYVNTDEIPLYVPAGTKENYEATEGWNVFKNIIEMGIAPSEGEDINYGGGEISGETNLNGNVVGNIYYNIGDENGEYSSAEGCITLRTPVSDEQMSQVEGMDLFGEDMKNNFTGIIFMVQAGSGTIKVNAETTGNMVLKVKVGSGKPMEFTLNGKMEAKLPYEVSEPTYVYIYGGGSSAAGAKGVRKAAGDGEVKIYGISWTSGTNGIETIDNGQLTIDNSAIYNLNGQRVISSPSGRPGGIPTKGIYIKNGKKVLVK